MGRLGVGWVLWRREAGAWHLKTSAGAPRCSVVPWPMDFLGCRRRRGWSCTGSDSDSDQAGLGRFDQEERNGEDGVCTADGGGKRCTKTVGA
jgi:hypothetical protein